MGGNSAWRLNVLSSGDVVNRQPHHLVAYLVSTIRERGMTYREVERQAGLGTNTISRWVSEARTPDLDAINKAFRVFKLRVAVVTDHGPYL